MAGSGQPHFIMSGGGERTLGSSDMIIDFGIVLMIDPSASNWAVDCLLPNQGYQDTVVKQERRYILPVRRAGRSVL